MKTQKELVAITIPSKMNGGKIRDILDKFENMENVPESILRELAKAIQDADSSKQMLVELQEKNHNLQNAFELLLQMHCELKEKCGLDSNPLEVQYDIFSRTNLLD
jgi:rRNA maturation endonuclease Nob1